MLHSYWHYINPVCHSLEEHWTYRLYDYHVHQAQGCPINGITVSLHPQLNALQWCPCPQPESKGSGG